jgi:hypothetical protein
VNKYSNKSKGRQVFAAQQVLNASHPAPVVATILTHEDIARHAYEIYAEAGYRQGHSEQNWLQAEQELRNQQHWLQAGLEARHQKPDGDPVAY